MHPIKISQLGEGLTEVRVVALLKNAGDILAKDEPLLEVETDKAVMVIETPHGGCLEHWLVQTGETIAVGSTVALINGESALDQEFADPKVDKADAATSSHVRNSVLSPREKARLKRESEATQPEISARQTRLGQLFLDSQSYVAEASLSVRAPWDDVVPTCRRLQMPGLEYRPTPSELIGWSVAQAMTRHPRFLMLNRGAQGYEQQAEVCVGNAVGLPHDELGVASLADASRLGLRDFIVAMRRSINEVRAGHLTPGRCQVLLSYMAGHNVWTATPRVLFPAVATLFIGTPYEVPVRADDDSLVWQKLSTFALTFDHRIINGVGAAAFLNDVVNTLASLSATESGA